MALIRIPMPEMLFTTYAVEFDSDNIERIEMPNEIADGPNGKELTGRSSLILHFATADARPKWVEP
jgi:hypothetical protein